MTIFYAYRINQFCFISDVLARDCPKGWMERGDPQCYLVVSAAKTFAAASRYCKEKGANLASVHGKVEMKFLDRYLKSKSYWIGLNDRKKENAFAWTDGTKVDYTKWGKSQPDNFKNEDCVELDKKAMGYVFNDNKCTKLLPFVCKIKGMLSICQYSCLQHSYLHSI